MIKKILIPLVLMLILLTGCGDDNTTAQTTVTESSATQAVTTTVAELTTTAADAATTVIVTTAPGETVPEAVTTVTVSEPATEPMTEPATEPTKDTVPDAELHNPLTNEVIVSFDELPIRPVAVAIGNNAQARPQSGLSHADIMYEVPAEGGVSRYVGIFYGDYSEKIGPCRSARPYIVYMASQYEAGLAHVGGSNDALSLLDTNVVPDIDEFAYSSTFWRSTDRKAPNNCYTSTENLLKWYDKHKYKTQYIPQGFKFMAEGEKLVGEPVSQITVNYPAAKNSYTYNADDGLYYRSVSGIQQVDPDGDVDIACANVIIQYISSKVLDKEGRLEIDLMAGGDAIYFINGRMLEGKWSRASESEPTLFCDNAGNEISLATGKTWIQMVDKNCTVKYE